MGAQVGASFVSVMFYFFCKKWYVLDLAKSSLVHYGWWTGCLGPLFVDGAVPLRKPQFGSSQDHRTRVPVASWRAASGRLTPVSYAALQDDGRGSQPVPEPLLPVPHFSLGRGN